MDEMSITPVIEFDTSSGQKQNYLTNLSVGVPRTVRLGGLASRWKQTVAYYFTDNFTFATVLKPIVLKIIWCMNHNCMVINMRGN